MAESQRRNARIYLTGLGVSLIGDNAMSLAAGIWVKILTGSSGAAALVSVAVYAPSLIGPLGGVFADRHRARPLLITVYSASTLGVLALLLVHSRRDIWVIYVVMLGYGTALILTGPAESVLFVRLFTAEQRQRLNGLSLALQESGRLVAPLAGAGLFALAGGGTVAILDSATFAVAAVATARLRIAEPRPDRRPIQWRADLSAGLTHIRRTPALRRVVIIAFAAIGLSGVAVAAQYSLVTALHRSPAFLGVLSALLGAGSILGGLSSAVVLRRFGESRLAALGVVNFAIGNGLRSTGLLVPALAGSLVLGFALPWCLIATLTLAQRLTPPERQGRVSAAISLIMFGPQPLTLALGAGLIGHLNYRTVLIGTGAVPLLVLAALHRRARPPHPTTATG